MNMTEKKVAPTLFEKSATYKVWRNKLDMWKTVSEVPKDEQGISVLLKSITNNKKVEKLVSTLTAHYLHRQNWLDI